MLMVNWLTKQSCSLLEEGWVKVNEPTLKIARSIRIRLELRITSAMSFELTATIVEQIAGADP